MNENCIECLYSTNDNTSILVNDISTKHNDITLMKCGHINSPYYKELVTEKTICRLFIDAQEYFKMKDRRGNLEKIKDNIRIGKFK